MPVEANDGLRFILIPRDDLIDPFDNQTKWPRLSCSQANQLALEFGDLSVDGKVGIGTTTPTEKLEVKGKVKATDLDVSGAITTHKLRVSGSVTTPLTIDNKLEVKVPDEKDPNWISGLSIHSNKGALAVELRATTDGFLFNTGDKDGQQAFYIHQQGNIGVGMIKPTAKLHVNGDVRVNGKIFVKTIPVGDKRNLQWDSSSEQFYQDTSSQTTKENIAPLEDDFTKILQVAPKTYTRPGDAKHWEIGYLAEEFHELGLHKLVYYDENDSPEAINYRKVSMYLVEVVKELEKKLQQHEQKLNQLGNSD
ncbi:MAG: hypothetical protein F6K36_12975 [Symploca sp. SIO3C6]|nr:hypothetical protein [Symploca sp. SIO3C6]